MSASLNRIAGFLVLFTIWACGRSQTRNDEGFIRREYRYSVSCLMTNFSALDESDFLLPIFQGEKGILDKDRTKAFIQQYGDTLCFDLPVGRGKSTKRIKEILAFYNKELFGNIDLENPKYIRLYGDNFGWLVIYEFSNKFGGKGNVRLNLPSSFENLLTDRDRNPHRFSDLRFNEEEIVSAYKKARGLGPYGKPNSFLSSEQESISPLIGTAGFMQMVVDYYQPSSWHCPELNDYTKCIWRQPN